METLQRDCDVGKERCWLLLLLHLEIGHEWGQRSEQTQQEAEAATKKFVV